MPPNQNKLKSAIRTDENGRKWYDHCKGKKLCGVMVLSSVSPICKSLQPLYRSLLSRNSSKKEFGLMAFVSFAERPGQNEDFASALGNDGTRLDPDRKLIHLKKVSHAPKYFVINPERLHVMEDKEAADWIMKNFGEPVLGANPLLPTENGEPIVFSIINPPVPEKTEILHPGLAPGEAPPPPAKSAAPNPEVKSLGTLTPTPFVPLPTDFATPPALKNPSTK